MNKSFSARALLLLAGLFLMSTAASAQLVSTAGANPGLDQCRNGGPGAATQCIGSAWESGNANAQQAHYAETQFLPYRFTLTGASAGTMYTVTIGYDIIKVDKNTPFHAIDYLGTFNNTETNADPCSDLVSGCTVSSPTDNINIPIDNSGATFSSLLGGNVPQPQGHFVIWGGSFHDAANAPLLTPAYNTYVNGDTHRNITIKFVANGPNVVIAWGGHVAWQGDWGAGNSAGGISGSPYHTNLDGCIGINGCGSGDVALAASAAAPAGLIRIIKVANSRDGNGSSNVAFPFTANSDFSPLSFNLIDNVAGPSGVLKESTAITSFGAAHTVTVTEGNTNGWTLLDAPTCTTNFGGTVVSSAAFGQSDSLNRAGAISAWVNPGGLVTCTFSNSQLAPTAAPASITGQVLSRDGLPMGRVSVSLVDVNTGEVKLTSSNSSGNYTFTGLTVEHFYRLTLSGKRAIFEDPVRDFVLHDDLTNVNFFCTNQ